MANVVPSQLRHPLPSFSESDPPHSTGLPRGALAHPIPSLTSWSQQVERVVAHREEVEGRRCLVVAAERQSLRGEEVADLADAQLDLGEGLEVIHWHHWAQYHPF